MANQAGKRDRASMEYWQKILNVFILLLNCLYILSLYLRYSEETSLWWEAVWTAAYIYAEYKLEGMILNEIDSGLRPNYSLDFFGILVFS